MSWDYHRISEKTEGSDNLWSASSDLFMMMSIIFLLLYVVSSVRNGTESLKNKIEHQHAVAHAEDLREQNRVYNALKDDYIDTNASQEEKRVYQELMTHLDLLKNAAHEEKKRLTTAAKENAAKEQALNRYQQIIRNIINANYLAKANLSENTELLRQKKAHLKRAQATIAAKDRHLKKNQEKMQHFSRVISNKEKDLLDKSKQLAQLKGEITQYRSNLRTKRSEIRDAKRKLREQIVELQKTENNRKRLQQKINQVKNETRVKIAKLSAQKQGLESNLSQAKTKVSHLENRLDHASRHMQTSEREKERLLIQLVNASAKFQGRIDELRDRFTKKSLSAKRQLERTLQEKNMSDKQRALEKAKHDRKMKKLAQDLERRIAGLNHKIKKAEEALSQNQAEKQGYRDYIAALENQNLDLKNKAKQSQDKEKTRKQLADRINKSLKRAKVPASVDRSTGDVTLTFGEEYFDTDQSNLKRNMIKILRKFVPIYAKNLFMDPKVSPLIESVEIVGFASPTYKGKYVDPQSLDPRDREAVNYNLDLSYRRAKSIFEYIFDLNKMKYSHQKKLLSLVNVSGRSYLSEGIKGRNLQQGLSRADFCAKYQCKKQQRVIIKFDLKEQY